MMALHHIKTEQKFYPELLFTTVSKELNRVSMHGVRKELITRQGFSLNIRNRKMYLPASNNHDLYTKMMTHEMNLMKQKGMTDVLLTGGGIIPDQDMKQLNTLGCGTLFPPGTDANVIINYIKEEVEKKRSKLV